MMRATFAPTIARSVVRRKTAPAAALLKAAAAASAEPIAIARGSKRRPTAPAVALTQLSGQQSRSLVAAACAQEALSGLGAVAAVVAELEGKVSEAFVSLNGLVASARGPAAGAEQAEAAAEQAQDARVAANTVLNSKFSACQALAEEAMCGDANAATQVAGYISDASSELRSAALEALTCLARHGPEGAAELAAESLRLSDKGLRYRSAEASMAMDEFAARFGGC